VTGHRVRRVAFAAAVALSLVMLFSPASEVPSDLPVSDKVVHFLMFALLAVTGRLAGVPLRGLAAGLVVYAGVSELLQSALPINRDGDLRDALADTLGALSGLVVHAAAGRRRPRRSSRSPSL
jgi:VanZ family protein